jgi:hypothetical protein
MNSSAIAEVKAPIIVYELYPASLTSAWSGLAMSGLLW